MLWHPFQADTLSMEADTLACVTFTMQHVNLSWPLTVAADTIDSGVYRVYTGPCETFSDEFGQYTTYI